MYYSYNFEDLKKCNREPNDYYSFEQLKKNVPLTAHEEPFYPDNGWCIYSRWDSTDATNCKDEEEAYNYLLEMENYSLYEYWHNL